MLHESRKDSQDLSQSFSSHSNYSYNTTSSNHSESKVEEASGTDFDYAAEMMPFNSNKSNLINSNNDEFDRKNADYVESSNKSRNNTLQEIQTHIREQHKTEKELKGRIQIKLYCEILIFIIII